MNLFQKNHLHDKENVEVRRKVIESLDLICLVVLVREFVVENNTGVFCKVIVNIHQDLAFLALKDLIHFLSHQVEVCISAFLVRVVFAQSALGTRAHILFGISPGQIQTAEVIILIQTVVKRGIIKKFARRFQI